MIKQSLNSYLTFFAAMFFLIVTGGNVVAGGLVDTSAERFMEADFTTFPSADITNPWWTLPEGAQFLYFAQDGEDCLWNLVEVLNDTTIDSNAEYPYAGTSVRIVLDRGWVDVGCVHEGDFQAFIDTNPEPEESTYDWYAQDGDKNIWYMGEDTNSGGDTTGSFVAGCNGAEAGIVLLGNPSKGDFHQQEFYEGEAEDWAKVLNFKGQDGVTCMTTKEWSPLEHGAIEHKWYCSDGTTGQLSLIDELQGKTLTWELVRDVVLDNVPDAPVESPSPTPSCP